ncbi:MAG: biotin/lipoyl-containing protein [Vicinamibacterales bacterium]
MTFEVQTGERRRVVDLTDAYGRCRAVVDGSPYALDVARVGDIWSLLVRPGDAGPLDPLKAGARRSYEVTFGEPFGEELIVYVNGKAVAVRCTARPTGIDRRRTARRPGGRDDPAPDTGGGPLTLTAPMPGRIVKVLVKVGDAVAARQGVVVVEAMKMENELRSPRAGTVKEVRVAQGALVEAKTVVVVIE